MRLLAVLGLLLSLLPEAAPGLDGPCTECCCPLTSLATEETPRLFAYGCYRGDGTQNRLIQTGIPATNAGLLFVNKVTTSEAFCNRWLSPTLVGAGILGRGQSNCVNNTGTSLFDGYSSNGFIVDANATDVTNGDSLNENLENFCWYEWSTAPNWHGTFTYTGNGSSPRTITLQNAGNLTTASLVMIQNINNGDAPVAANAFVGKTSDMATTQSVIWAHSTGAASDANMIRGLGTNTVEVGSHLNENAVVYHGAWWNVANSTEGGVFNWTGNGTSGGNNCGTGADVQTFGPAACSITGVVTMEDFFDELGTPSGCAHQECDAIRAQNISNNLAGPGNITGDDFYIQQQAAPDDTDGLRLVNGSMEVTGGPATETSCNDNTQTYFSAFWCKAAPTTLDTPVPTVTRTATVTVTSTPTITNTPAPTATPTATSGDVSAPDWSSSFVAVWEMDEASGATRASTGTCTTDCALANNNNVLKDTTSGHYAFGSGGAQADTSLSEYLSCDAGTCNEINLASVAGATWGCYGYVPTDAEAGTMMYWTSATNRWNIQRTTTNNNVTCQSKPAATAAVSANTALNSWTANSLTFAACTFDDANNELKAYAGGSGFGSAATQSDIGSTTTGTFQAGGGDFGWTGTVDTCFVEDHELSDTDICRICSCGINGALGGCVCSGGGASYTNTGLNATKCNSCTLPACNKAAPD